MKYYFKQSIFMILYNIFISVIAFAIMTIPDNLLWLRMIVYALNIGLYLMFACAMNYKEGQDALKIRYANDLEREQIVKTGNALPLKLHEEYKPWKGYFIGFLIGSPIVICLIIHSILILIDTAYVGAGAAAGIYYLSFFGPIEAIFGTESVAAGVIAPYAIHYLLLYAIPILSVACGIAYNLGAAKIQRNYDKIAEKQRMIYGK